MDNRYLSIFAAPPEDYEVRARCQHCKVNIYLTRAQWEIQQFAGCLCAGTLEEVKPDERSRRDTPVKGND